MQQQRYIYITAIGECAEVCPQNGSLIVGEPVGAGKREGLAGEET